MPAFGVHWSLLQARKAASAFAETASNFAHMRTAIRQRVLQLPSWGPLSGVSLGSLTQPLQCEPSPSRVQLPSCASLLLACLSCSFCRQNSVKLLLQIERVTLI